MSAAITSNGACTSMGSNSARRGLPAVERAAQRRQLATCISTLERKAGHQSRCLMRDNVFSTAK